MRQGERRAVRSRAVICVTLGAVLGAVVAPAARAETPTLLCQRDEVIRIVDRTVRTWNRYNRILPETAGEAPTQVANVVTCLATMSSVAYALTPDGWLPRPHREARRYDVQVIGNRLFVQVYP